MVAHAGASQTYVGIFGLLVHAHIRLIVIDIVVSNAHHALAWRALHTQALYGHDALHFDIHRAHENPRLLDHMLKLLLILISHGPSDHREFYDIVSNIVVVDC